MDSSFIFGAYTTIEEVFEKPACLVIFLHVAQSRGAVDLERHIVGIDGIGQKILYIFISSRQEKEVGIWPGISHSVVVENPGCRQRLENLFETVDGLGQFAVAHGLTGESVKVADIACLNKARDTKQ